MKDALGWFLKTQTQLLMRYLKKTALSLAQKLTKTSS